MQLLTDVDVNKKAMFTLYWIAFRADTGWQSRSHTSNIVPARTREGALNSSHHSWIFFSVSGSSCAIAPTNQRPLDSETRTTTSTRFSHIFKFLFQLSQFYFYFIALSKWKHKNDVGLLGRAIVALKTTSNEGWQKCQSEVQQKTRFNWESLNELKKRLIK